MRLPVAVVVFFIGTLSLQALPVLPKFSWILVAIISLMGLGLFGKTRRFCKIWGIILLGFIWSWLNAWNYAEHLLPKALQKEPITLLGRVAGLPQSYGDLTYFTLDIDQLLTHAAAWPKPGRISLKWHRPPFSIEAGDQLQLTVKLRRAHNYSNPGSFDKERQFLQNRWSAEGSVDPQALAIKLSKTRVGYLEDRVRLYLIQRLESVLKDPFLKGPIIALVSGEQSAITPTEWQVFRNTGTAHLMAISGLHIGFVASLIFFTVRLFCRFVFKPTLPTPNLAALLSLVAAIFYAWISGFGIATQRAVIMVAVWILGILLGRIVTAWHRYFLSLGLVLLWDPFAALSPGFWLSFGSVGLLIYALQGRASDQTSHQWLRSQWVVAVGLLPLSLLSFGSISWLGPIANTIAIPWVSFSIVPLSLVGALLLLLDLPGGESLVKFSQTSLQWLWPILEKLNQSWALTELTTVLNFSALFALLGILWILAPKGMPGRFLGWLWLLPLLWQAQPLIPEHTLRLTVLDVGQGLAAVLETRSHILIYDTGPKWLETDAGERIILPFLKTRKRSKLDTLLISHNDMDHRGGARTILNTLPVSRILASEPEGLLPFKGEFCQGGQSWLWDGVRFEILHPYYFQKKRNDRSCVLKVSAGGQSVLLTGDIEAHSEGLMIKEQKNALKATVLLVPHHGSKSSSTQEFIDAVSPRYAVFTVGYLNQYGLPKAEVLKRYRDADIEILNTSEEGALVFWLGAGAQELSEIARYRRDQPKFWYWSKD